MVSGDSIGEALVPYYRQILPIFNMFKTAMMFSMGMDDHGGRFLPSGCYGSDEDSIEDPHDSDFEVSVEDKLRAKLLRKPTHEEIAAFEKRRRKERRRTRELGDEVFALLRILEDPDSCRTEALRELGEFDFKRFGPPDLIGHLSNLSGLAVVACFEDTDWQVRKEALKTLGKIEPAEFVELARDVVVQLGDLHWAVRKEALKTLGKLEPATLVEHAKDVAFCLNDSSAVVRRQASETLRKLEPPQYAVAVSAWLVHSQKHVREAALETLGKLALATLAPHLNAVVAMRCDTHAHVREKARQLSGRLRWYRCRLRLLCVERLASYWYALPYRPSGPGHARDVAAWDRMNETRGQTPRLQPPEQSGAEADESTSSESLAAPTWTCHRCRYLNYGAIRCALCGSPKKQPAAGPHETARARKRRR